MATYSQGMTQEVTYWAPGDPDGFGRVSLAAPVLLAGRWQDDHGLYRDANAREFVSTAIAYLSEAVALSGYLALGDFTDSVDPSSVMGAEEIRHLMISPSFDGIDQLVKAVM